MKLIPLPVSVCRRYCGGSFYQRHLHTPEVEELEEVIQRIRRISEARWQKGPSEIWLMAGEDFPKNIFMIIYYLYQDFIYSFIRFSILKVSKKLGISDHGFYPREIFKKLVEEHLKCARMMITFIFFRRFRVQASLCV